MVESLEYKPYAGSATNVKVSIRFRPEFGDRGSGFVLSPTDIYDISKGVTYKFDEVFTESTTNTIVFERAIKNIVDSCVEGFNGTVFAYGQTASGKTYTMQGNPKDEGITSMSVRELFRHIKQIPSREFEVSMTYLEVYNEKLIDLLANSIHANDAQIEDSGSRPQNNGASKEERATSRQVKIADTGNGIVEVKGATTSQVHSVDDVVQTLAARMWSRYETSLLSSRCCSLLCRRKCQKNRHISETAMNERSSRSHTIVQLKVQSRELITEGNENEEPEIISIPRDLRQERARTSLRVGLLNLVDLAGSEAISRAQTEGQAKLEGSNINKSLLALSKVISQIVQRQQRGNGKDDTPIGHINYRDSKLTRLLSNSLGGNSKTAIICCVSPDIADYRESVSTLDFASRAKCIRNKVRVNLITEASEKRELVTENRRLRDELVQLRRKLLQLEDEAKSTNKNEQGTLSIRTNLSSRVPIPITEVKEKRKRSMPARCERHEQLTERWFPKSSSTSDNSPLLLSSRTWSTSRRSEGQEKEEQRSTQRSYDSTNESGRRTTPAKRLRIDCSEIVDRDLQREPTLLAVKIRHALSEPQFESHINSGGCNIEHGLRSISSHSDEMSHRYPTPTNNNNVQPRKNQQFSKFSITHVELKPTSSDNIGEIEGILPSQLCDTPYLKNPLKDRPWSGQKRDNGASRELYLMGKQKPSKKVFGENKEIGHDKTIQTETFEEQFDLLQKKDGCKDFYSSDLVKTHQEEVNLKEKIIEVLKGEIEILKKENQKTEEKILALELEKSIVVNGLESQKAKNDDLSANVQSVEISKVLEENRLHELEGWFEKQKKELDGCKLEIQELSHQSRTTKEEHENTTQQVQNELNELKRKWKEQQEKLQIEMEENILVAKREVKQQMMLELYEAKEKAYNAEGQLEEKTRELEEAKKNLTNKLQVLDNELIKYKKIADERVFAEAAQLQAERQCTELVGENKRLHKELVDLQETQIQFEFEQSLREAKITEVMEHLKTEKAELQSSWQCLHSEFDAFKFSSHSHVNSLESTLHDLSMKKKKLIDENENKQNIISQLEFRLSQERNECHTLEDRLGNANEELDEWRNALRKIQSGVGRTIYTLQEEVHTVSETLKEQLRKEKQLEKDYYFLKLDYDYQNGIMSELLVEMDELKFTNSIIVNEIDVLYDKLFGTLEVMLVTAMASSSVEYDIFSSISSSQYLHTHLLMDLLTQEYFEKLNDINNDLIDLCCLIGEKYSTENTTNAKNEEKLTTKIRDLEIEIRNCEYEQSESLRQIRLEAEQEIDQLRQMLTKSAMATNAKSSANAATDTHDMITITTDYMENTKTLLLKELQKMKEKHASEYAALKENNDSYKQSMDTQKSEMIRMITEYKAQIESSNQQLTLIQQERAFLQRSVEEEMKSKSEYQRKILALEEELTDIRKELEEVKYSEAASKVDDPKPKRSIVPRSLSKSSSRTLR